MLTRTYSTFLNPADVANALKRPHPDSLEPAGASGKPAEKKALTISRPTTTAREAIGNFESAAAALDLANAQLARANERVDLAPGAGTGAGTDQKLALARRLDALASVEYVVAHATRLSFGEPVDRRDSKWGFQAPATGSGPAMTSDVEALLARSVPQLNEADVKHLHGVIGAQLASVQARLEARRNGVPPARFETAVLTPRLEQVQTFLQGVDQRLARSTT